MKKRRFFIFRTVVSFAVFVAIEGDVNSCFGAMPFGAPVYAVR
jgi:hypothetical protein